MNFLEWLGFNKMIKDNDSDNVIKFPEKSSYIPEVKPPEKSAQTLYRIGMTDNERISFQMGYSELTMNKEGVDNLIKQLEVFRDQLPEPTEE